MSTHRMGPQNTFDMGYQTLTMSSPNNHNLSERNNNKYICKLKFGSNLIFKEKKGP